MSKKPEQSWWDKLWNTISPSDEITIDRLESWVQGLDDEFESKLRLKGVSYERTADNELGFPKEKADFTVFMPWGSWAKFEERKRDFPAPLQEAVLQVLEKASAAEKDDKLATPFMDLASLVPGKEFFTERAETQASVAKAIADWVNAHDPHSTAPCIRFLVGDNGSKGRDLSFHDEPFTDMFWPVSDGKRVPLVTHPKARIYVGYYNPNFRPQSAESPAITFIPKLVERVAAVGLRFGMPLAIPEKTLEELTRFLVTSGISTVSWNHGKVMAVNGDVLMTGGANYQKEYQNYSPWNTPEDQRRDHEIYDHQAKVFGGAAISAHKWADYFWRYLQNVADTDGNSTWWGAYLSDPGYVWYAGHEGREQSSTIDGAPKIGVVNPSTKKLKLPEDVAECPIRADMRHTHKGTSTVFTVSKLGDWYGPKGEITYPAQVIDAARDILLNVFYQKSLSKLKGSPDDILQSIWGANELLSDDWLLRNPFIGDMTLQSLKINPTAWASRYTKTWAIAFAQESVIICQQLLVGTLQADEKHYKSLVAQINSSLELAPDIQWDGHIWPFDLMIAIAKALVNIWRKAKKTNIIGKPESSQYGVSIVLSTSKEGDRAGEGWHDKTPIARIQHRISLIMKGIPNSNEYKISADQVDEAVNNFLRFKRVMGNDGKAFSHSKIVCVDKTIMYIGSDNAYPSYNEEHGIWIDDKGAITTWLKNFFEPYWDKCTTPDPAD